MATVSILGPFLPAIMGALLMALSLRRTMSEYPEALFLIIGAGGLLGYLAMAAFMEVFNEYGLRIFRVEVLATLYISSILLLGISAWRFKTFFLKFDIKTSATFTLLAAVAITAGYQSLLSPVSSWDAFELWAKLAANYIDFDAGRSLGQTFTIQHWRHPWTVINLSALSAYSSAFSYLKWGTLSAWYSAWLCTAIVTAGTVHLISKSILFSALAFYFFTAISLLENHAILHGYADLWIAAVVGSSCGLWGAGIYKRERKFLLLAVVFSFMPLALKGSGLMYSACLWAAGSMSLIVRKGGAKKTALLFSTVIAFIVAPLIHFGFDINLMGNRFALTTDSPPTLFFSGYVYRLEYYPIEDALWNMFFALFINQSFSVLMISYWPFLWLIVRPAGALTAESKHFLVFLLLTVGFIILAFLLPQLIVGYADEYAVPTSDTGGSRFIMPIVAPLIMALSCCARLSHQKS